jgi:hypothetical protein
MTWISMGWSI